MYIYDKARKNSSDCPNGGNARMATANAPIIKLLLIYI